MLVGKATVRKIILFSLLFLSGVAAHIFTPSAFPFYNFSTFIFCAFIIFWAPTIQQRILNKRLRLLLTTAAIMLLTLFVLRVIRYNSLSPNREIELYIWYAYYIPTTALPL